MQEAPRRLLFIVMEDVLHHCQKLMFSANYFILSINFKYCIYTSFLCVWGPVLLAGICINNIHTKNIYLIASKNISICY